MEYLMTYGWAILIVIIVGIVLWKSGIFGGGGGNLATGFGPVTPQDWSITSTNGTSQIVWQNSAGQAVRVVSFTFGANTCVNTTTAPSTMAPGKTYLVSYNCTSANACPSAGGGYAIDITVSYTSEANVAHSNTGTIRGTCA
jgi:hypothetical protein